MALDNFTIRVAADTDAAALAQFGEQTFRDTFGAQNRAADMNLYLEATYSLARVQADLRDSSQVTHIVDCGGKLVAYAQLRAGATPACVKGNAPLELLRFYVDGSFHGRGVARALMHAVLTTAKARQADSLWLGVWERNARAIAFYAKCGFSDVGSQPFDLGTDRQTDRIMATMTNINTPPAPARQ
jgi:diamine N-acetyltransferase